MDLIEFKKKYEHKEVIENPNSVTLNPIVSVCVQTYQHVNFIGNCLDSILMQETDFDFEILLGEDASIDGTREICIKYAEKYPEKIRLFLHHRENNISIGGSPTGRFIFLTNLLTSRGKYIALCEGDDYWTDPLKLQKQVDFLEEHSQFSACFTNALVLDELNNKTYTYEKYKKEEYDVEDIIRGSGSLFPTASLVFRNKIRKFPLFFCKAKSGDRALALLLANLGKFYLINEKTCVYRRHNNGIFSSILKNQTERIKIDESNIQLLNDYNDFTNKKYDKQVNKAVSKRSLISLLRDRNKIFSKEKLGLLKNLTITDGLRLIKNLFLNKKLKA